MIGTPRHVLSLSFAAVFFLLPLVSRAGTYSVLYDFCAQGGCADGAAPNPVLIDQAGDLFGTTQNGGNSASGGVVFELSPNGTGGYNYTLLYTFCSELSCKDGRYPYGALISDTSGNLYGVTAYGGAYDEGEVFELAPNAGNWTLTVLYSFCALVHCPDGATPIGGLTYAGAASGLPYNGTSPLFGTAQLGGTGGGTAYSLQPSSGAWVEDTLYSFSSPGNPLAGMIVDSSGNLYGTAENGGNNSGAGGVFELSLAGNSWNISWLYDFCSLRGCSDGNAPAGGVVMAGSGQLWGLTLEGGGRCFFSYRCGTIYSLSSGKSGYTEAVSHDFCSQPGCADGGFPWSTPILDSQGNLFGTAYEGGNHFRPKKGKLGDGTLFELTSSGTFSLLYRFCSQRKCADGAGPLWGVTEDQTGDLIGTTRGGGTHNGGVVYEFSQAK